MYIVYVDLLTSIGTSLANTTTNEAYSQAVNNGPGSSKSSSYVLPFRCVGYRKSTQQAFPAPESVLNSQKNGKSSASLPKGY